MGTSKGYGGPSSGLVPSWIDDVSQPAAPAGQPNGPSPSNPSHPGTAPSAPVNNDGTGSTASNERGLMREVENFRSHPPAVMFAWENA